ncbi:MAG: glycosyltransferase [Chthoniobacterales bacterium]
MKRLGFIINSRLPNAAAVFSRGMLPHHLLTGWDDSASPMSLMRFHWIADAVNKQSRIHYELYKPWRHYDALMLVKSMAYDCTVFAKKEKARGTRILFDANVDYYTAPPNDGPLPEMAPTENQRSQALEMTGMADGVMASSRHLAEICSQYSSSPAEWIPDNVNLSLIPSRKNNSSAGNAPLLVWWSGMPQKAFEFLAIETTLRKYASRIHLHLVTNDLSVMNVWSPDIQQRFRTLLKDVPHTIHAFGSVENLLRLYADHGGIVVSPRFLDTPYNLGHSEWKLTLAMACGLPAVCSPVPSYGDVAARAPGNAIRICQTEEDWSTAFSSALDKSWDLADAGAAAIDTVEKHYSTAVVAEKHLAFVSRILS